MVHLTLVAPDNRDLLPLTRGPGKLDLLARRAVVDLQVVVEQPVLVLLLAE
jgi:hypothetical protein